MKNLSIRKLWKSGAVVSGVIFVIHLFVSGYVRPTAHDDSSEPCANRRFFSLTTPEKKRLILTCDTEDCSGKVHLIGLTQKHLREINDVLGYSSNGRAIGYVSSILEIGVRNSTFMMSGGNQSKVVLGEDQRVHTGEMIDHKVIAARAGIQHSKIIQGKGESWRECSTLPATIQTINVLSKDIEKTSAKNMPGYRRLIELRNQLVFSAKEIPARKQ